MIPRTHILILALASLILPVPLRAGSAASVDYSAISPPVEMRGLWIDAGAIPKTEAGVKQLVRQCREANLNVLFPEVIARGYAVYRSRLLARDPRFAGAIDPLEVMIKEAHRLGMEVHPWVWVLRAGYSQDRGAILTAHPTWAELDSNGKEMSSSGGLWISPALPEARKLLMDLFSELLTNYQVDGLHLDYVRYESSETTAYGYNPASRALFEKQYGLDPLAIPAGSFHQLEWAKFRERQINTFVQSIYLLAHAIRPTIAVSAAVAPYLKEARLFYMQNWPNWVDNKWLDFLVPMSYSSDDAYFSALIGSDLSAVGSRTLLAPGIGVQAHKQPEQTVTQIGLSRERGAAGQVLFAASYFKPAYQRAVASGPYASRARIPYRSPLARSAELQKAAANQSELVRILYDTMARRILDYVDYRSLQTGYVAPSPPPLRQPQGDLIP